MVDSRVNKCLALTFFAVEVVKDWIAKLCIATLQMVFLVN